MPVIGARTITLGDQTRHNGFAPFSGFYYFPFPSTTFTDRAQSRIWHAEIITFTVGFVTGSVLPNVYPT